MDGMTCESCETVVELEGTTNSAELQKMTAGWVQVPFVVYGAVSWWTLCGTCGSPEVLAQGLVDLVEVHAEVATS